MVGPKINHFCNHFPYTAFVLKNCYVQINFKISMTKIAEDYHSSMLVRCEKFGSIG